MGPYVVVLPSPVLYHHSILGQSPKLLSVEGFFSKAGVETLHVSILPWASWLDVEGLNPLFGKPATKPAFDELRAVVASDVIESSLALDKRGHDPSGLSGVCPTVHVDAQALARVLVDHVEHAKLASAQGRVVNEVPGPDVIAMPRLVRKARRGASKHSLGLLGQNGEAKFPAKPLNHAGPDRPAIPIQ